MTAVRSWGTAALSGLFLAAAFPPVGSWWLSWAALTPLLTAVLRSPSAKFAANLGGFTGLVLYSLSLHWLVKIFGVLAVGFWCALALFPALFAAMSWWLWNLWPPRRASAKGIMGCVLIGIFWAALEYFRSEVWPLRYSWLSLGYSQTNCPTMLQSCRLWGVYGLSAAIASVSAALAVLARGQKAPAVAFAAALGALAVWGRSRLVPAEGGRPVKVALVQDESGDPNRLMEFSHSPATTADLVVWPEYSWQVPEGREPDHAAQLGRRLRSRSVVVVGAYLMRESREKISPLRNFAWVFSPDGSVAGRYDKMHPIPFVERGLSPNRSPRPVTTPLGKLGMQLCYDLDFEDGSRAMARQGAEILVVPNLDPESWGEWQHRQHSAMAPVRAVESGLWIIRAASSGLSQIIDPSGRVIADLGFAESAVLRGEARLAAAKTLYSRIGWLTGPLCLGITVLAACAMRFRGASSPV